MKIEIILPDPQLCNYCPCLHAVMVGSIPVEARCGVRPIWEGLLAIGSVPGQIIRPDWCKVAYP
jgi:hypothetical protein